jgi:hypothetical protein
MKAKSPAKAQWLKFYEYAQAFSSLSPWEWMYDTDLFAIQNPADGQYGYCNIMGTLGEVNAFNMYLGLQGLENHLAIIKNALPSDQLYFSMNSLIIFFEKPEDLNPEDKALLNKFGIDIKQNRRLPLARRMNPGHPPRLPNSAELSFLTLAVEQAIHIAGKTKHNEDFLLSEDPFNLYTLKAVKKGRKLCWQNTWQKVRSSDPEPAMSVPVDELALRRIISGNLPRKGTWEMENAFLKTAVKDKSGDPFHPVLSIAAEHGSGFILGFEMHKSNESPTALMLLLTSSIEKHAYIPQRVQVSSQVNYNTLEDTCQRLGINLEIQPQLSSVNEAMDEFNNQALG